MAQIDVARRDPTTDWPEFAEGIHRDAARTNRLVNDLLLFARSDEGELRSTFTRIDLDDVALESVASMTPRYPVQIRRDQIQSAKINADANQIKQIASNLIANAVRHAQSRVDVTVAQTNDGALLAVDDDGSGVHPMQRELIFERFARLDEGRSRDSGGAGLGLAISQTLAQRNGATLAVMDSALGGHASSCASKPPQRRVQTKHESPVLTTRSGTFSRLSAGIVSVISMNESNLGQNPKTHERPPASVPPPQVASGVVSGVVTTNVWSLPGLSLRPLLR